VNGPVDVLLLRFQGPLQSWGERARWVVRDTRTEPTKSGVIGMIAAASGWGLTEEGDQAVAALAASLKMAVRVDLPGEVICDYQTVVGGALSAEGKIKINASTREPETVESWRYYLADACFLVALAGPRETLIDAAQALQNPVWTPFLGRRSCPPSAPLVPAYPGREPIIACASLADAVERSSPWMGEDLNARRPEQLRCVIEVADVRDAPRDRPLQRRQDVPLSFRYRRFGQRYVRENYVPVPKGE
jgi:CRISPR system Cascade subunit CasD